MKHTTMFFLIALLAAGCSKPTDSTNTTGTENVVLPATPSEYPSLVVDEDHQIQGSNPPEAYQIAGTAGIRLDVTKFHFTYGTNAVTPNMVQFVGSGSVYRLSRPTETNIYVIDHTTMEAVRGGPFHGFRPGDHMMFAIGRSMNGLGKEDFWVSWAGEIEVK